MKQVTRWWEFPPGMNDTLIKELLTQEYHLYAQINRWTEQNGDGLQIIYGGPSSSSHLVPPQWVVDAPDSEDDPLALAAEQSWDEAITAKKMGEPLPEGWSMREFPVFRWAWRTTVETVEPHWTLEIQ